MRYSLLTLLILLAVGPPVLWACAVLYDTWRWLETYPGPDPTYITGHDPLRWTGGAICLLFVVFMVLIVGGFIQRRRYLLARDRQEI